MFKHIKIILLIFFNIFICFHAINLYAKTIDVYYCEANNGKRGYYDRPCQKFDKTVKQTILSLPNYINKHNNNYKQHDYTKPIYLRKKLNHKRCNKIDKQITFIQKLLKTAHKKSTIVKLKRKLHKYQLFKKNSCNSIG